MRKSFLNRMSMVSSVMLSSLFLLSGCFKEWTMEEVESWYEKHPETFTEYMEFAREKAAAGKTERAESLYAEAISMTDAEFGSDDIRIATAATELGELQEKQGHFVEAEKSYRRAYEIQKKKLAPNNKDLAKTKKELAAILVKLYKKDEADYILTGRKPAAVAPDKSETIGEDGKPRRKRPRANIDLD
ncbi:MAG: tetratricopeptide repeat protein [Cyanobacteria bacterium TGS_CYA1]|nr:tetratricopeptide repeat protein [Cyanobacteria bacterium TGS_CYA1]